MGIREEIENNLPKEELDELETQEIIDKNVEDYNNFMNLVKKSIEKIINLFGLETKK